MAKAGRGADQYMVRFPRGLRDRVKAAAASNGRSMNEEIVRLLERTYPEPWPLDVRLHELSVLMGALRKVRGHERALDAITGSILETAEAIAAGHVPEIDEETRNKVREELEAWHRARAEKEQDRYESFDYPRGDLDDESDNA
jgi:hypothetical protein